MNLIRTMAIAWLTIRQAIRSRLLLSLAFLLVTGLAGLALLIGGGNTLAGKIQVILTYTHVYASAILAIATLSTACGGLATEIQERLLYLVLTKPLHRHELWLGKWLGIMGINLALLALTGLSIAVMTRLTIVRADDAPEVKQQVTNQYLMTRKTLRPVSPDWTVAATEASQRLIQSGRLPKQMTPDQLRQELATELNIQRFTIPPGGGAEFSFPWQAGQQAGQTLMLAYKFDSTRPERSPIAGHWTIGNDPTNRIHLSVTNYPGIPATLSFPGLPGFTQDRLTVNYQRHDAGREATLLLADKNREPELLIPFGGFEMNLLRSLLIILAKLAFLAALGLTAGSLLSTPVAIFTAGFFLILMSLAGYVQTAATTGVFYIPHEGHTHPQSGLEELTLRLFQLLNGVTQPLSRPDPAPLLATGRLIGWNIVLMSFGWLVALYTPLTALLGIALFKRRELG